MRLLRPADRSTAVAVRAGAVASLLGGLAVLAVAALPLAAAPALAAPAAAQPPVWQASISPTSGTDESYFSLVTSGGCPASNVLGRVFGHGLPAAGSVVVGNTSAGVSATGAFTAPLGVTLRQVIFDQPELSRLTGTYRLVLTCRAAGAAQSRGDYVAQIIFSTPTSWTAAAPLTTAQGPVGGPTPETATSAGTASAADTATTSGPAGQPGAAAGLGSGAQTAPQTPAELQAQAELRAQQASALTARSAGGPGSWPWQAGAAALVLLVLAYLWRTRTTATTTPALPHPLPISTMTGAER